MNDASNSSATLGNYELLTRLETGGMAEIFLARETGIGGLERLVVIKRILPEYGEDPEFTEMFLREARIVARINDPNVVQVFELGEEDGDYFMAMEYIDGMTIAELVKASIDQGRWFSLGAATAVIQQACKGLHEVHEVRNLDGELLGLIHRDVSHQNFMTDGEGFVKLIDFGIAKSTQSQEEATHSGSVKGKYSYMSPEQCRRLDLDRRSDIFSLGIVAWELFAGARLFKRDDKLATIEAITEEEIPPPSTENTRVPDAIDRVVLRALRKDPDERYQTASEFREGLLEAAGEREIATGTDPLGAFVQEIAGDLLEDRRRKRREALEDSSPGAPDDSDRERPSGNPTAGVASSGTESRSWLGFGAFIAACLALAVTGWYVLSTGRGASDGGPVTITADATVQIARSDLAEEGPLTGDTEALLEHLERTLDRRVELARRDVNRSLSDAFRTGEIQFALLDPLSYIRVRESIPDLKPLVARTSGEGSTTEGILAARADSEVEQVGDLRGERICFTDRESGTGYLLPWAHILRNADDPGTFLGPPQWSGDSIEALRDLLSGRCTAAATSSAALHVAKAFDLDADAFRTIAVTGRVPQDAVVAGPKTSDELVRRVREALLAFDPDPADGGGKPPPRNRGAEFSSISDGAYDELREARRAVEN